MKVPGQYIACLTEVVPSVCENHTPAISMTASQCRMKAEECYRRSTGTQDEAVRGEWCQLGVEWHYLAHQLAGGENEDVTIS